MKNVRMKALNITVPLKAHQYFSDDGYVDNLEAHTCDLIKMYEVKKSEVEKFDITNKDNLGFCFFESMANDRKLPNENYVHIYYLKTSGYGDIFIRAHEETHALLHLGKLKYLFFDMIKNMTTPPLSLILKNRIEDMANYSGIYAMQKRKLI